MSLLRAPHGYLSYYFGPALDHYRCHSLYLLSTKSSRVIGIVDCFAKPFILPGSSVVEQLHELITDMGTTLSEIAKQ